MAQETYPSLIPFLAVAVSLVALPMILSSSRHPNLRETWTMVAAVIKFCLVLSLLPHAFSKQIAETRLFDIAPGVALIFRADPFGIFFALVASFLWILTSLYSIGYVRGAHERHQTRYFACFAVCLSATVGIAFAANLLTFILFYEVLTVATYPLVAHKQSREAIAAGRKYLVYTLSAGVLLIAAAGITYALTGSMEFIPGGLFGDRTLSGAMATVLFFLFLGGVGVKAGVVPLHGWLPTAMIAPTPVSALLHAVAVVKSGVFGIVRIVGFVLGPDFMVRHDLDRMLLIFAGATILFASLIALRQDNLKKRLAYSTVGHLSYIVLGTALLSPAGFAGGVFHIATHAFMKITLFFCAGAIYVSLHRENVSELDGVGKVMPWTMGAFAVGAAGLAGIPPINGFASKWMLGLGAMEKDQVLMLLILITSGLLNAAYLFPIVHRAFFRKGAGLEGHHEASFFILTPLLITAGLSLLMGLKPDLIFGFLRLALDTAYQVLGGAGP